MSETFECPKCGYRWPKGAHGGHSCSDLLLKKLEAVNAECLELVQTLKAILHLRPPYIKANKLVAIIEHKAKAAIEKHGKKR